MRTPEDIETDADGLIRLGAIVSVDLAAARCIVRIDDEAETPPLRWIESAMGATRTWSPPSAGEQVVVLCPAGEIAAGIVLRGLVSTAKPAPGNSMRELIKFSDGAEISYDPEAHKLDAVLPAGGKVAVNAPGGFTFTGNMAITGNITLSGNISMTGSLTTPANVTAGGKSLKTHTHGGVTAGSDLTGAPS